MPFRLLTALAFLSHMLLSNPCLIGTAQAADAANDVPMSRLKVFNCPWEIMSRDTSPRIRAKTGESPCASGNCFSEKKPKPIDATPSLHVPAPALAVTPTTDAPVISDTHAPPPDATESPPAIADLASVVLML